MSSRLEIAKMLRKDYQTGTKKEKTRILDHFCNTTGLGRSTARRHLTDQHRKATNVVKLDGRSLRPTKYSLDSRKKLIWVWRIMGMPSGKYMAAVMAQWLDALEAHGELVLGQNSYTPKVREELVAMSAATIDRYLKQERDRLKLKGISTTKPGALLRSSITIRKAGDEIEQEPGFSKLTRWLIAGQL